MRKRYLKEKYITLQITFMSYGVSLQNANLTFSKTDKSFYFINKRFKNNNIKIFS